ncbi:MAG: hypothetical protein ACOVP1_08910 [Bacteroidia bacterium]
MASTVRIPKYKAINFKKLSFLYLIFIVFYFSSTSGDFVRQYINLEQTQKRLNDHLESQLFVVDSSDYKSRNIKNEAFIAIAQLNKLATTHDLYLKNMVQSEEALKESKFVSGLEEMGIHIDSINWVLQNYVNTLPPEERATAEKDLGLIGEKGVGLYAKQNTFIKGVPTGVFGSIIQHYKTVVLSSALDGIQKSKNRKIQISTINKKDSSFLVGFNHTYEFGEQVKFNFLSEQNLKPEVIIDDVNMEVIQEKEKEFYVNWIANKVGDIIILARLKDQVIKKTIKVLAAKPSFLENKQEIACFINEPISLKLEKNSIRNQQITFSSNAASIQRKADEIIITPLVEGRFVVEMKLGDKVIDQRVLFAGKGEAPRVVLKDIIGNQTQLKSAHCLESESSEWQVVNFNFICIDPNGITKKLKSNTRFLRNELRTLTNNLPAGSTIIFDQIKLLNKDGNKTSIGSPIFIEK